MKTAASSQHSFATVNKRLLLGALLAGCASAPPPTIEPGISSSQASPRGGTADDSGFVLSRTPVVERKPEEMLDIHPQDVWWPFRAAHLKMDEARVKQRDAALPENVAPDRFWDEQTAVEAVSLWSELCNECHGGRRRLEDAQAMPPPPPGWGQGDGIFFGQRRKYVDVFATIYKGGPARKTREEEMPAWRGKLAKEMIWSLIYFLEFQSSGAIVSPPSLSPKRSRVDAKTREMGGGGPGTP